MASKTAIVNNEERSAQLKKQEPGAIGNLSGNVTGAWGNLTHFLTDVRSEMRKVVTPSRKEVETTTSVVLVAVFLFGLFFFVVDFVFDHALHLLLTRLGGAQ